MSVAIFPLEQMDFPVEHDDCPHKSVYMSEFRPPQSLVCSLSVHAE